MGWIHENPEDDLYDHEGHLVAVLATGAEPPPVEVPIPYGEEGATSPNSAWWLYDGSASDRPLAAAVRAACSCGWRSAADFPVDFSDHEATEGFEFNDGPFAVWQQLHIGPMLTTVVPTELRDAIATVRQMTAGLAATRPLAVLTALGELAPWSEQQTIAAAVQARTAGMPWSEIGAALGTTRQAAFQRFARHMPDGIVS